MSETFSSRPAWYLLGALIGLVVLSLFALANRRIGAVGGFSSLVEGVTRSGSGFDWRLAFLAGIFGGALLFHLAAGSPAAADGYGWLTRAFSSDAIVICVLVVGGGLIGFGAKQAGGCTSGNGLGGCASGSPASLAATGTFMAVAIAASFLIEALT